MKKVLTASIIALSGLAQAAYADSHNFYIFAEAGKSDYDIADQSNSFRVDNKSSTYGIGIGYRFNKHLSIETGYLDLGEYQATTIGAVTEEVFGETLSLNGSLTADTTGLFLGVRADYPINEQFNLYGRAGLLDWESDLSFSGTATYAGTTYTGGGSTELDSGTDPYIGIGIDYAFNDSVSIDAKYTRYMLDLTGSDVDIDALAVGISFKF